MLISNFARRLVKEQAAWCMLMSLVTACTLTDYGYLGAQRDTIAIGGQGGMTAVQATSPSNGGGTGSLNTITQSGGSAWTGTQRTGVGGTSPGAGGTSNVALAGSGVTITGTGGVTVTTSVTVVTGGKLGTGGATSAQTTVATTGGTPGVGGTFSTGGSTNVSTSSTHATGGVTSAVSATSTGGNPSTGGVTGGGGIGSSTTNHSTPTGGAHTGGASVTGGSSSTGGTSGSSGSSGTGLPTSCSGCAILGVPFNMKGQVARFLMLYTPAVTVTTAGILRARVFALQLGNTQYQLFIQQDSGSYTMCFSGPQSLPSAIASSWVTLDFSLASCSATTAIGRLGLELIADTSVSAPTPSYTQLWVDSIWIEANGNSVAGPFNFDSPSTVNAATVVYDFNQSYGALYLRPTSPTPPPGSTLWWGNG